MATVELTRQTQALLEETLPNEQDIDAKVRQLIQAEHLRELGRYRRTDLALTRKYNLTFDEFTAQHTTRRMGYSWEVEQDAMAWETAVGGIATMERKLKELRELDREQST
ncbi:MAG: hypothetical protein KDE47_05460 [Caldilineaceae bacterium]|nr:hypothetical protein [Anaerolineales bacterium]MCB0080352.1 hypothetical protein [Caldilineaceae bacterium]